jgi:phage shock protein PspC (stress-responsive transcriptional regulator)
MESGVVAAQSRGMTSAPPPAPPSVDPPGYAPPPPPPGPPVRPQLRRSRTDKIIGGVNGGLAEYSGIDPLLWRVGFVALALAGGTGIIVYLLLWLLMPAGPPLAPGEVAARQDLAPAGPRSPVPGITIAGLLIAIGALVLVDRFADIDIGSVGFLGTALLVVGAGLVVAAFTGGRTARGGLIALGVVLSLALITASTVNWRDVDGVGDRTFRPLTAEQVRDEYHGGVGDFTLDLSEIDVSDLDRPVVTRLDAGVGDVEIVVPRDADVRIHADSGIGDVTLFGDRGLHQGEFPGTGTGSWVGDGVNEIVLTVNSGIGDVEVSRG